MLLNAFCCPITKQKLEEPVVAADGHSYSSWAIKEWLRRRGTSPLTRERLQATALLPNHALKKAMVEVEELQGKIAALEDEVQNQTRRVAALQEELEAYTRCFATQTTLQYVQQTPVKYMMTGGTPNEPKYITQIVPCTQQVATY
jgi:hypothetical protein